MIKKTIVLSCLVWLITLISIEGYRSLSAYNRLPMADDKFLNYLIEAQRLQREINTHFAGPKISI